MSNIPGGKYSLVQNLANAMNKIPEKNKIDIKIKVTVSTSSSEGEGESKGNVTVEGISNGSFMDLATSPYISHAKGNIALASGSQSTLMGELGPELVVSNGRYFVVGQNGAEMVDLDKDAIVFNHLQTQRLLNSGKAGRGIPVTNERNAVSLATGNINGGPAMSSASSALATLKNLKALWESIASMGLGDLAGLGGGGGGGGGKKNANFIYMLELWFDWLQDIARIEKQITHEEKVRAKL